MFGSDDRRDFQQLLVRFDTPAFVRRAKRVEEAWAALLRQCQKQRDLWLDVPRVRLALLVARAGSWSRLEDYVADPRDVDRLRELWDDWKPQLQHYVAQTSARQAIARAFEQLIESLHRFNAHWLAFINSLDLSKINAARDGYNRYYVFEKECALGSPLIARQGFEPLPPCAADDLLAEFPVIDLPSGMTRRAQGEFSKMLKIGEWLE
jgi:hypothetical protein